MMNGTRYIHRNSGDAYEIVDAEARLKFDGVWYDAVTYRKVGGYLTFTRTRVDFAEAFRRDETPSWVTDLP